VAVIGGGIVGLCCAYELDRAGAEAVVLERGAAGSGASRGNTGWVCPSFTYPLPGPGIIREGLRGMLRGGGPLAIRPTLDPTFVRWLLGFRRSAARDRWEKGVTALIALNGRTLELFDAYAAAGIEFEMHRSGLLLVVTQQSFGDRRPLIPKTPGQERGIRGASHRWTARKPACEAGLPMPRF
jgi:D-amino-acid dehydrogenase